MQTRFIGFLSLVCLIFTILWLVFLVAGISAAGPLETFDQVLDYVKKANAMYYITYVNAALVTVSAVMLFSVLYIYFRHVSPAWSVIGFVFIPVYGVMNLIVYLSQVTIVPMLIRQQSIPEYNTISHYVLRQAIQQWPESAVYVINNLAYAVLGIPSVIFGILMFKSISVIRAGGLLLLLSGIACIIGFIGIALQSTWLNKGSLAGGIIFLFALFPVSWGFMRSVPNEKMDY